MLRRFGIGGALGLWIALHAGAAAAGPAVAPADTARVGEGEVPRYLLRDPVRSTAREMTLREIMARAVEGERTKLAGHHDMTFNATLRSILTWKHKKEIRDEVFLVYQDADGVEKSVRLVEKVARFRRQGDAWVPKRDSGDADEDSRKGTVRVQVEEGSRGADLSRLPFFLKDQEEYDFSLLDRTLEGDHVIFKIAFHPRSPWKPLPSGTVYVDTDAFRVIHEEFTFEENPAPVFLKDIERVSRHWTKLPGGEWVASEILARLHPNPAFGLLPGQVDVVLTLNDYRFDQGYDARKFGPRKRGS